MQVKYILFSIAILFALFAFMATANQIDDEQYQINVYKSLLHKINTKELSIAELQDIIDATSDESNSDDDSVVVPTEIDLAADEAVLDDAEFNYDESLQYTVQIDGEIVTTHSARELQDMIMDEKTAEKGLALLKTLHMKQNPHHFFPSRNTTKRDTKTGVLIDRNETHIKYTPTFYKMGSSIPSIANVDEFTWSFDIESQHIDTTLQGLIVKLPQRNHMSFVGHHNNCTINNKKYEPIQIVSDDANIDMENTVDGMVQGLFFDYNLKPKEKINVSCLDSRIVRFNPKNMTKAASIAPLVQIETSAEHAQTGESIQLIHTVNVRNKLPTFKWYHILIMSIGAGIVVCGAAIIALVVILKKRKQQQKNADKLLVDADIERSKPEEKQSLLSATPEQFVAIV